MSDIDRSAQAVPAVGSPLDGGVRPLVERLRAMARHEHDDLSIGDEAADEIGDLREQLACVRQALPEAWRDSVPSVAVATLVAELELLRKDGYRPELGAAVVFKCETRAWFMDADLAEEWASVHCPGATVVEA